jgi:hypothetical protein
MERFGVDSQEPLGYMTRAVLTSSIFWDTMLCSLAKLDVSEQHTVSFFGVEE